MRLWILDHTEDQEHSYWGPPESGGPSWRPAPKIGEGNPGSDLAGETAAEKVY